jgi:Tfp pilus assembly protein PilV
MIVIALVVYVAGMLGLLVLVDRRLSCAQAAREAAFLRQGFGS